MCQDFTMSDNRQGLRQFLSEDEIANLPDQRGEQSWPFEPYLRLKNENVQNNIDLMLDDLCVAWLDGYERKPSTQSQQDFIDCANVIMANLLRASCRSKQLSTSGKRFDVTVGIHRRKGRLDQERRYRPKIMTASRVISAQDRLIEFGQMYVVKKGYNFGSDGQTTRVALTDAAAIELEAHELSLRDFLIAKPDEAIQLKDKDGQLCQYIDTGETCAMRAKLEKINSCISCAEISTSRDLTTSDRKPMYIGPRTNLIRIFNHGSFETGGRFHGGWWQYIKSHARRLILLDGLPTVEVDYRGFNPAVLLAKAGQRIPKDPYSLISGVIECEDLRDHAKTTLAALLNSESGRTVEPKGFDIDKHGMTVKMFRQSIIDAFPMLPDLIGKNVGMKIQREESDLAEKVMSHFVDQGHPILPIHDAFMVQEHLEDELVETMQRVFQEKYGQVPYVKTTFPVYLNNS